MRHMRSARFRADEHVHGSALRLTADMPAGAPENGATRETLDDQRACRQGALRSDLLAV